MATNVMPKELLPRCVVCENAGKFEIATHLAYIARSIGSTVYFTWELVCKSHWVQRKTLAFELVKVPVKAQKRMTKP